MLRLHKPVITRFTSYHLVNNELLRDMLNDNGANSLTGRDNERYNWGSDADWVPYVQAALEAYARPSDDWEEHPTGDRDSYAAPLGHGTDEASAPTVIILSSGAHWSTLRLDGAEDPKIIEDTFASVVAYTTVRLKALPRANLHLRILARTNPPPMDDCLNATEPLDPPNLVPPASNFNYESFPVFDDVWRNNPSIEVLDLRPLVGTRPDGRRMPRPDCLHVCIPVARSWVEVLWNVL
ncbi:hypothetical protein P7C70_g276, partial [Phenoliferia sp. Uapishka_3]